ncbi:SEC-C motif-containing protein [Singulisphaera sp. GP187]|uniref:SEC-C metal-binding domain-containing protein n=1 Tax=Singulisphaera sp. GP187 TaxID=1882752 RepID=UPI00092A389D|nr:SEC-C metal-binding domain-containing protein [Singulisphaera sp. GP187]SIO66775.1 SEC-C motif-containing protein [Singulisphaera sp. GP187]
MFDNRWDNWSGDFAESFVAGQLDPRVLGSVSEILSHFGQSVRSIDRDFPDEVSPGTFATVLTERMPRLVLPEEARPLVPEVIAQFLEYLRESGRVGEGADWAAQIRVIARSYNERLKPGGGVKGVPIRRPAEVSSAGRNDPCPCGSGKKYKKCCLGRA